MSTKNKKSIEESAILEAKKVRKFWEEDLKKKLSENFSNELKELVSQSVLELDDDFDFEEEDLEVESVTEEEEEYDDDVAPPAEEPVEDVSDDEEQILKDLEAGLADDEPTPEPEEEEELEEGATHEAYDDVDSEESGDDFISELEKELDDLFADDLTEGAKGDGEEEEHLDEDGYPDKPEDKKRHYEMGKKKYKKEEETDHDDKEHLDEDGYPHKPEDKKRHFEMGKKKYENLRKENLRLKKQLGEIYKDLSEMNLDSAREKKLREITNRYELSERVKFNVVKQLDKATDEKSLKEISQMVESIIAESGAKRKSIKESTKAVRPKGINSSIRMKQSTKKSQPMNESVKKEWGDRFAELIS